MKADLSWTAVRALMWAEKWLRMPFRNLPSTVAPVAPKSVREPHVMVPMRDGVRLFTDVYRPATSRRVAASAALPVMLIRVPYGARESYTYMPAVGRYWARRGFVCVIQDVRGRFGSEGDWVPMANEVNDGYDTIDWVARQEWCDGRVVMTGESYFAFTQWAAAASQHPALSAVSPGDMGLDQYTLVYEGGAFCLGTTGMWLCDQSARRYINYFRLDPWHLPVADMPRAGGITSTVFDDAVTRADRDSRWDEFDHRHLIRKVQVPVLVWTGWYDVLLRGTLQAWAELEKVRPGGPQQLIIGPTDHETSADFDLRVGRIPVPSGPRSWDRVHTFMMDVLSNPAGGAPSGPRVRAYQVGANSWHELEKWPIEAGQDNITLFPHSDGRLALSAGVGNASYRYDPADPVAWWAKKNLWAASEGLGDRTVLEKRNDILVFRGDPLSAPLGVLGAMSATVAAKIDTPGTDITAALVDVFPNGYTQLVTEGIIRITPGMRGRAGEVNASIDLGSTGHQFGAGHSIGLELASSNFPRWDRNMNSGNLPALTRDGIVATVQFDLSGCRVDMATFEVAR